MMLLVHMMDNLMFALFEKGNEIFIFSFILQRAFLTHTVAIVSHHFGILFKNRGILRWRLYSFRRLIWYLKAWLRFEASYIFIVLSDHWIFPLTQQHLGRLSCSDANLHNWFNKALTSRVFNLTHFNFIHILGDTIQ